MAKKWGQGIRIQTKLFGSLLGCNGKWTFVLQLLDGRCVDKHVYDSD